MIEHIYYRCCRYTSPSHPRIRVKEKDLDFQAKEMLQSVQFLNAEWEEWAKDAAADYLRSKAIHTSLDLRELKRQISLTQNKREQLLDLLLAGSVTGHEHDEKKTKLLKRESELVSRVAAIEQSSKEIDCKAKAAPSLFDKMRQKWDTWDVDTKHRVLRLLFGGFRLDGVMLVQVERTPIELFRQSSL